MLIQALRQLNIKKKTHRKLRYNEQFVEVDYKGQVNSILILVEECNEDLTVFLSNEFGISKEDIKILEYLYKVPKENIVEGQFSEVDFEWFGKIKNKKIEELVGQEYDVLLNYTVENIYMDYLTSISNAKFKVGYSNADLRLYDFMIDIDEPNVAIFNSELKKYLKILNK